MILDDINTHMFPFGKLLGIRVTAATDGVVKGEVPVREEICTTGEILLGGAVMAFAESMGAIAASVPLP